MQNRPQTPRGGYPSGGQPIRRTESAPQTEPVRQTGPVRQTDPVRRTAPPPQRRAASPAAYGQRPVQRDAQPVRRETQSAQKPQAAPLNRAPSLAAPFLLLLGVLIAGILLQFVVLPGGWVMAEKARATETVAEIVSTRGVRINEVMTANKAACFDETGACPDWIELHNAGGAPVDITGWVLTDKASRSIRFAFPAHVMQPDEYVIVFADGFLHDEPDGTWHAPFKLSSYGDTLMLFDENGTIVESINIPELAEDTVYARSSGGGWAVTREYTPLLENTTYNYAQLTTTQVVQGSDLVISEIMASNASHRAPSGVLCDWIEITNRGGEPIDLSGYGLSDKTSKPARWRFPDITIQPGEFIVVYASGLDRVTESGELHTGFSLAAEGESVLLYSPARQVIDVVSWDNLKTDQSYKRQSDDSWSVSNSPTPGGAN